jgi:hypothetical protein
MGGLSKPKLASSQDSLSLFENQSICGSQFIATIESSLSLSFRFHPFLKRAATCGKSASLVDRVLIDSPDG